MTPGAYYEIKTIHLFGYSDAALKTASARRKQSMSQIKIAGSSTPYCTPSRTSSSWLPGWGPPGSGT